MADDLTIAKDMDHGKLGQMFRNSNALAGQMVESAGEVVLRLEEQNILRFVDAVEADKDLELLGTNADVIVAEDGIKKYHIDELFVLRDKRYNETDERAFPKAEVAEIAEKCTEGRVLDVVEMVKGDKNNIVLQGITRIVGYYSRVNSWNKSKVGELRDRGHGSYWSNREEMPTVSKQRQKAIDAL